MTTASPVVRLGACPRCKRGALTLHYDIYGGYWDCLQCGFVSHDKVPQEPRIRSAEAMRAYTNLFAYAGPHRQFQGVRLVGRGLRPKRNEEGARFDLNCPYVCSRRQVVVVGRKVGDRVVYKCRDGHHIYLDLDELTWR